MSAVNSDSMRAGASGAVSGYTIDQSCRFNPDDNTVLQLTPAGAGDTDRFSVSFWFKRCIGAEIQLIFSADSGAGKDHFRFQSSDKLQIVLQASSGLDIGVLETTRVFRDPTAWYHLVFIWDSANGTAGDRMQLYINGVRETAFDTDTNPTSGVNAAGFNAAVGHAWGHSENEGTRHFNGYIADIYFIDGTAQAVTDFGEFDDNGNWVPIDATSLTFGTNGYHLDFADSANLGNDANGGTDWAETGLAANDQVSDSPTDDAENDVGNYCTWNPIYNVGAANWTLSNGNLDATYVSSTDGGIPCTFGMTTGKWYWEMTAGSAYDHPGIASEAAVNSGDLLDVGPTSGWDTMGGDAHSVDANNGNYISPSATTSYGVAFTDGDVIGFAYDANNGTLWFSKNDTWMKSATKSEVEAGTTTNAAVTGLTGTWFPFVHPGTHTTTEANFGQQAFAGDVPTGYNPLCTAHLAAPAITDPSKYFQVDTFTGTGSELARTLADASGATIIADLVWIKDRDSAVEHVLTDSARGATKEINPDSSLTETTVAQGVKSFSPTYTLGTDGNYNASSSLNVAWVWNTQGGAGASNTDGSINTTTTSVGTTQGLSISTWTGTAANATIGHGLTSAPEFIMVKNRTVSGHNWAVYHKDQNATPEDFYLILDEASVPADAADRWNDTAPTSTLFSLGTADHVNESGGSIVAFCWHGVEGYSKFGSYEGNGSTNGSFVWCGFRPAWLLLKAIDSTSNWFLFDHKRNGFNAPTSGNGNPRLVANSTEVTDPDQMIDILSNGFKLRIATDPNVAETYIFAAFAEFPFGGEDVSQARAR